MPEDGGVVEDGSSPLKCPTFPALDHHSPIVESALWLWSNSPRLTYE